MLKISYCYFRIPYIFASEKQSTREGLASWLVGGKEALLPRKLAAVPPASFPPRHRKPTNNKKSSGGQCCLRYFIILLLIELFRRLQSLSDLLCFLNIDLIGENGITKSSVDQELKIEISGPATLQGYGSARPNVEESFCNDTFKTFYGKSLAVIRAGYEPGTVTVKVSGKGLDTQELTLNIC